MDNENTANHHAQQLKIESQNEGELRQQDPAQTVRPLQEFCVGHAQGAQPFDWKA